MSRPDPSDGPQWRAYAVISNALHKAIEVQAGRFMLLSERERIAGVIWDELAAHGVEVRSPEPRCTHTSPLGRCKLAARHPVSPMFGFFTDYDGHLYDDEPPETVGPSE